MESDPIHNLCSDMAKTNIKTVTLEEAVLQKADEKVSLSLVGKILSTKKINRDAFRSIIPNIWRVDGISVEHCRGNIYVFRFDSETEKKRVLNGGPWSFNNSLIVLEEPTGSGDISKMLFNRASFWVQIHDLPVICMTKEVGWSIGSQLGRVEDIDGGATGDCLGKFLRIRISLDISVPLEKEIYFVRKRGEEPILLGIAYERMPEYCYYCGCIGHSNLCCVEKKTQPESVDDLVPNFGPELRALSPNRSRNSTNSNPRPPPSSSSRDTTFSGFSQQPQPQVKTRVVSTSDLTPPKHTDKTRPSSPLSTLAPSLPVSSKGSVNKSTTSPPPSPNSSKLPKTLSPPKLTSKKTLSVPLSPSKRSAEPSLSHNDEVPIDPGEVSSPLKQKRWKRIARPVAILTGMDLEEEVVVKRPRGEFDLDGIEEVSGKKLKVSSDVLAVTARQHCHKP